MASVWLQHVTNRAITVSTAISVFENDCWKSGPCCGGNEQRRDEFYFNPLWFVKEEI